MKLRLTVLGVAIAAGCSNAPDTKTPRERCANEMAKMSESGVDRECNPLRGTEIIEAEKLAKQINPATKIDMKVVGDDDKANQAPVKSESATVPIDKSQGNDANHEDKKVSEILDKLVHNYSMKEGNLYGYQKSISQDDINSGAVATPLMMFRYAGSQNGKLQVFNKEGNMIIAEECELDCKYLKVMTFIDNEHVKTDRLPYDDRSIGSMVMMDAINGQLEQSFGLKNKKSYYLWFDEKKGVIQTPVKP